MSDGADGPEPRWRNQARRLTNHACRRRRLNHPLSRSSIAGDVASSTRQTCPRALDCRAPNRAPFEPASTDSVTSLTAAALGPTPTGSVSSRDADQAFVIVFWVFVVLLGNFGRSRCGGAHHRGVERQ